MRPRSHPQRAIRRRYTYTVYPCTSRWNRRGNAWKSRAIYDYCVVFRRQSSSWCCVHFWRNLRGKYFPSCFVNKGLSIRFIFTAARPYVVRSWYSVCSVSHNQILDLRPLAIFRTIPKNDNTCIFLFTSGARSEG